MTSMFPQIFQNFKLLECSSTQSLFRYIYIIIQLIPNLTIISDDICKELMKVVLKMYDAVEKKQYKQYKDKEKQYKDHILLMNIQFLVYLHQEKKKNIVIMNYYL